MTSNDRLARLLQKIDQLKAQAQAIKQREAAAERKKETRRKILIGAAVLARVRRGEWPEADLRALLDAELKENRDRALFGLTPLARPAVNPEMHGGADINS